MFSWLKKKAKKEEIVKENELGHVDSKSETKIIEREAFEAEMDLEAAKAEVKKKCEEVQKKADTAQRRLSERRKV